MGGKAFTSGPSPLLTPRMPSEIYDFIKQRVHSLLFQYFEKVGTPIEAPEKSDHGDIDFLVAEVKEGVVIPEPGTSRMEWLGEILGAERWIMDKPRMNFAVAWPEIPLSGEDEQMEKEKDDKNDCGEMMDVDMNLELKGGCLKGIKQTQKQNISKFIQIDIHICPNTADYTWKIFQEDHGDLWNILGSLLRHQGLTVTDKGLFIRIPAIEASTQKGSMIHLSSDPDHVLDFLELKRRWRKFDSVRGMFEYVTMCRFFYVKNREEKDELNFTRRRKRSLIGRPVFQQWHNEYLPQLRKITYINPGTYPIEPIPREIMTELAFTIFGPAIKPAYDRRLRDWNMSEQRKNVANLIKESLPPIKDPGAKYNTGKEWIHRCEAIKGLKKIALARSEGGRIEWEGKEIILEEVILDGDGLIDLESLREWVRRWWREVGDLGLERLKMRSAEAFEKEKEDKKGVDCEGVCVGGSESVGEELS